MIKYAIMVCLDGKDDWVYVTEEGLDGPEVVCYNTSEQAEELAEVWRLPDREYNVKVVTYGK